MDEIDQLYNETKMELEKYIHNASDIEFIDKSYYYAKKKHEGQFRKSGEPYIIHPISVAKILAEMKTGPNTIAAGFLHDVVEDTQTSLEEIKEEFNEDVMEIVDGLTKIDKLSFISKDAAQIQTHQKMLLAMSNDIRVILVKLADRLHNIRTLGNMPLSKQVQKSKETLDIYAPIAGRLGMYKVKAELEDTALKYIDPYSFQLISEYISNRKSERDGLIDEMISEMKKALEGYNITQYRIFGRVKNIYSIYKKVVNKGKSLDDIYDLFAIRIILDKVETCYQVLGIIHAHYAPLPMRFKDYIAVPKQNMYQSLHTTIVGKDGKIFEIQIRTEEMDAIAENGIAAHWAYKENVTYSKEKEQYEIAHKLKWYGELLKLTKDSETLSNAEEFVDTIKGDILDTAVYVFSPKGEVIDLPKGSTPLDFAFKIHTELGYKTTGALVNNKIVPLNYELKNGDVVSILTNKNSFGPSEDWLKIVQSQQAKHKIKAFLNKQNRDSLLALGKDSVEKEMISQNIKDYSLTDANVKEWFGRNNLNSLDELYVEIGKGIISAKTVVNKLVGNTSNTEDILQKQMEKTNRTLVSRSDTGVIIKGMTNPKIRLGNCCHPIPGDPIIGFVTKGTGIVVHTRDCKNMVNADENRFLEAYWASEITRKYPMKIVVTARQRDHTLTELMNQINADNFSIAQVRASTNSKKEDIMHFTILGSNLEELELLILHIKKIKDVYKIERE